MTNSYSLQAEITEIRNISLLSLVYFALEMGVSPAVLEAEIGIDVTTLDTSGFTLIVQKYKRLLDITKKHTGLAHPGLQVGARMRSNNSGILGYVQASCKVLGESIQKFYEYNRICQNIGDFNFQVTGVEGKQYYTNLNHALDNDIKEFISDAYATSCMSISRELTGVDLLAKKTCFLYPEPNDLSEYRQYIKGDLEFGCDYFGIHYCAGYHDLPVKFPNKELLQVFENYARLRFRDLPVEKPYAHQVIQILNRHMNNMPGIDETAAIIEISRRKLQQKLKLEDTCFNDLRNDTRSRIAKNYLVCSSYPAYEIGFLIGYSEPSVFYRAFKQWTGLTPNEFRVQHRDPVATE